MPVKGKKGKKSRLRVVGGDELNVAQQVEALEEGMFQRFHEKYSPGHVYKAKWNAIQSSEAEEREEGEAESPMEDETEEIGEEDMSVSMNALT
ncbi:hypothetical protein Droror1_Dr00017611, partial [Drosera rotundifolia]